MTVSIALCIIVFKSFFVFYIKFGLSNLKKVSFTDIYHRKSFKNGIDFFTLRFLFSDEVYFEVNLGTIYLIYTFFISMETNIKGLY